MKQGVGGFENRNKVITKKRKQIAASSAVFLLIKDNDIWAIFKQILLKKEKNRSANCFDALAVIAIVSFPDLHTPSIFFF